MKKALFFILFMNIATAQTVTVSGGSRGGEACEGKCVEKPKQNRFSDGFIEKSVRKGTIDNAAAEISQPQTIQPPTNATPVALENPKSDNFIASSSKTVALENTPSAVENLPKKQPINKKMTAPETPQIASEKNLLINYGNPKAAWIEKFHQLADGKTRTLHIVQIGDSHTAGDYFSDAARQVLQRKFGNAGLGLVPPLAFRGQRVANVNYHQKNWAQFHSRTHFENMPFGGMKAVNEDGQIIVALKNDYSAKMVKINVLAADAHSTMSVKDANGRTQTFHVSSNTVPEMWQQKSIRATPPLTITASDGVQLGALQFENGNKGVIYSALGVNGAQLKETAYWQTNFANDEPDLIVVAFGTNEAFSKQTAAEIENSWRATIRELQLQVPRAGIVIIGAPESVQNLENPCARPPLLDDVQKMQQKIAHDEKLLFWSWQEAMGGACQAKKLFEKNLLSADGVHFSVDGYQVAGEKFAAAILDFIAATKN